MMNQAFGLMRRRTANVSFPLPRRFSWKKERVFRWRSGQARGCWYRYALSSLSHTRGTFAAASNERFLSLAESSRARASYLTSGDAVRAHLEEFARYTSTYRSLTASIGTVIQCGTPGCNAITAEGRRLLQRGQETGSIRSDVTYDDFIYVVTAISIAIENDHSSKSRIGHLVDLFLNGISVKSTD